MSPFKKIVAMSLQILSCIVVARTQLHIEGLQVESCIDGLQINITMLSSK
jgi:hypothetical protein